MGRVRTRGRQPREKPAPKVGRQQGSAQDNRDRRWVWVPLRPGPGPVGSLTRPPTAPRAAGPTGRRRLAGHRARFYRRVGRGPAFPLGSGTWEMPATNKNMPTRRPPSWPPCAPLTWLRTAGLEADFSPVAALAKLEGAGLTLGSGGRAILQVAPVPKAGTGITFPINVNGRQVGTVVVARAASGLLPAEANLRTRLVEGIALSALVAAALAVSFALLASRRLVSPLNRLTVAVTRYGEATVPAAPGWSSVTTRSASSGMRSTPWRRARKRGLPA